MYEIAEATTHAAIAVILTTTGFSEIGDGG